MESEAHLSETDLSGLRSQFPRGWRFLKWPEYNLSSSDAVNIQADSRFCLPVRENVPAEMQSSYEKLKKMAPKVVLFAAEKAHRKGLSDGTKFLSSNPEGELSLCLAHCWLGAYAEFARQFGAELYRDGTIRVIQMNSGLPQDEVRNLWRHVVPDAVKFSRGQRGVGAEKERKKPVDHTKKPVGPKNLKLFRFHGEFVLSYFEHVIFHH